MLNAHFNINQSLLFIALELETRTKTRRKLILVLGNWKQLICNCKVISHPLCSLHSMMKKVRVLVNGIEIKESPPSSLMRDGMEY